eukprot:GGOE01063122.1.p1 GENE.GGOE01063122.1~~GGOE01063122.1.p1  ORF type:complete len:359 (+),score=128.73 GGOE01063122.1:830-1906(+)
MFWFGIHSGFSGTNYYDDFLQSMWNVFFTGLPILVVPFFNKDVHFQTTLLEFPEMYGDVQKGQPFTLTVFGSWVLDSIVTGVVAYVVLLYSMVDVNWSNGKDSGFWLVSFTSYAAISTMVNVRLWMNTKTWNGWVVFANVGSLICFFIFSLIYQMIPPKSLFFVKGNTWLIVNEFWVIGRAWAAIALSTVMGLFVPFVVWAVRYTWLPPTLSIAVARQEGRFIKEQCRIDRMPGEDAWARMLPLLRYHTDQRQQQALQHTNSLAKGGFPAPDVAFHTAVPVSTPTNSPDLSLMYPGDGRSTFQNAVTDVDEPFVGYTFNESHRGNSGVVSPSVGEAHPKHVYLEHLPPTYPRGHVTFP